jgi:predicted phosphoribosyltransferase
MTLAGFSVSEESMGGGTATGVTVSAAVRLASPEAAEIVTAVDTLTALVLTHFESACCML